MYTDFYNHSCKLTVKYFYIYSMPKDDDKPDNTFLTQATVDVPEATKAWSEAPPQEVSS
jgi:hypothetical protein